LLRDDRPAHPGGYGSLMARKISGLQSLIPVVPFFSTRRETRKFCRRAKRVSVMFAIAQIDQLA
jgi:hypothetical protein